MDSMRWYFLAVLLFPFVGWSQIPDSIIAEQFENFFGSDCPIDTVIEKLGKDDECILFSNEYKLCRVKNGRVKWTIDLRDFSKGYTLCMTVLTPSKKPKKRTAFIIANTGNFEEMGRMVIEFPSGKILSTSDSKDHLFYNE